VTPELVAAYAKLCLKNDFGKPIEPAAHHWLWLQFICDESIPKLLIIAPPESAKTTWLVSAYLACKMGKHPDKSFIIAGVTEGVAEKRSVSLRTMTDDPLWQGLFPGVKRAVGMEWTPVSWSLAMNGRPAFGRLHPTIAAYGTGGSITGSRADEILSDDLLDFDNTRTAYQREFVKTWFHNSLLSRRKSKVGRVVVIGTSWHQNDLYQQLKADGDWVVVKTPLLSDGPEVYATVSYPVNWQGELLGEALPTNGMGTKDRP